MANWKLIASSVGSLLGGAGIGYILAKIHYKRALVKEVNEYRMAIVQASHRIETHKQEVQEATDILEATEESNAESTKPTPDTSKETFQQREIEDYVDYTGPYANGGEVKNIVDTVREKDAQKPISGPYSIDPDEYGTIPEYDQMHLTYYSDGVLVDDDDILIEGYKLNETIGSDFKSHFGDYSEDGAWFRNDDTQCEYEVERSMEPYYGS